MKKFGQLPIWWIKNGLLHNVFRADDIGGGIAAMKCLLALSVNIDFYSRTAQISLTDLEDLTGLSRPMITKGLKKLEENNIVRIDREPFINIYELTIQNNDSQWAKTPVDSVKNHLRTISNRGMAPFVALKIYILLLSYRYRANTAVKLSHGTMRDRTGVQTNQIRFGLDVLYCSRLIHLIPQEEKTANVYEIIGL